MTPNTDNHLPGSPLNDKDGNLSPDARKLVDDNFDKLLWRDKPNKIPDSVHVADGDMNDLEPPANQGDDELANMLQHIYINESLYFSFTEDGVHPNKVAIAIVQAHFDWLLAERLQKILDSPPFQLRLNAKAPNAVWINTNIARQRAIIKGLMP